MTENRNKQKPKKRSERHTSKGKKFFKIVSITLMFLVLTAIVTVAGYAFAVIKSTEDLNLADITNLSQQSKIFDANNELMDTSMTDEKRNMLESNEIPQSLKDAYMSIEDERFESHQGIDIKRILGAAVFNVKSKLSGSDAMQGGSTLTQQLIKNTVLTNEKSLDRKIKEAYLAIQLEKQMTKDEILTAYLNTIPLGGLAFGVEASSQRYFAKSASELNLIESAYIAGLTQAPGSYDAFTEKNQEDPSRYIKRVKTVLAKMLEHEKITQAEYDQAISDLDNGKLVFTYTAPVDSFNYEWFTRAALDQVKEDLIEKLGYTEDEAEKMINKGGLEIHTTMDRELQHEVQAILDDRSNLGVPGSDTLNEFGTPDLQASAVITDYKNGQVKAIVGGRGKQPGASLNRASGILKSPGSSVKPLTAYGPFIDMKLGTTGSVFDDAPFEPALASKYGYKGPNNYGNTFRGYTTLNVGIAKSLNPIAAKVVDAVGIKNAKAYGEKFGLTYTPESETISALALGEFHKPPTEGGNPYQMANAFGAFGNEGVVTEGMFYTEVKDSTGKVILKAEPTKTQAVSPQTAYIMYDMLRGPIPSVAAVPGISTVGKTGTSTDSKDFFFAGLTPYYSASVWVGYDMPKSMSNTSSTKTSASVFGKIMRVAHKGLPSTNGIARPSSGIVNVSVCADSGMIPTDLCARDPRGSRVVSGLGLSGSQPKGYCTNHVSVKINKLNGKVAGANTPASLIENRVYIKKPHIHKGVSIADYQYIAPYAVDDMTKIPQPEEEKPTEEVPPADGGTTEGTTPPTPPATGGTTEGATPPTTPPPTGGTTEETPPADGQSSPPAA